MSTRLLSFLIPTSLPLILALASNTCLAQPCPIRLPLSDYTDWEVVLDSLIEDHSQKPEVNVLLMGDTGKKSGFALVALSASQQCDEVGCDFAVLLGDNFYINGSRGPWHPESPSFGSYFYEPLGGFVDGFNTWTILGNHGYKGCPEAQIDHTYLDVLPEGVNWLMPDQSYSISKLPSWLNIHVIDTESLVDERYVEDAGLDPKEYTSAAMQDTEDALCGASGWRILIGHHPAYTTGTHAPDSETLQARKRFGPTVEACQVHFYISGHDHDQEILEVAGAWPWQQIVQGAGSSLRPQGETELPEEATSLGFWEEFGFAIISFTELEATVRFYGISPPGEVTLLYEASQTQSRLVPKAGPASNKPK